MKQLKKKKGFTLVELIVVIAIIAILAAIAVPTTMHFVDKANVTSASQAIDISQHIGEIFTTANTNNGYIDVNLDGVVDKSTTGKKLDQTNLIECLNKNTEILANLKQIASIDITIDTSAGTTAAVVTYEIKSSSASAKAGVIVKANLPGTYDTAKIGAGPYNLVVNSDGEVSAKPAPSQT